jgi:hypothetical protein
MEVVGKEADDGARPVVGFLLSLCQAHDLLG